MVKDKMLNIAQKKSVQYTGGPLLIVAGARTGKTTGLLERIKWLIQHQKVRPDRILALTFTEKAAQEMTERLDVMIPLGYEEPWISTFHSFCDRILPWVSHMIHYRLENFDSGSETILSEGK